ncbi:unnamed protein product, partial [Didymodactylos carnosus]
MFVRFPFGVNNVRQNNPVQPESQTQQESTTVTRKFPTNTINLSGSQNELSQPICPPVKMDKTHAEEIVSFMKEAWKLKTPELIISVTGGAALFKTTPAHVRNAFQRDLIAAADTTGI